MPSPPPIRISLWKLLVFTGALAHPNGLGAAPSAVWLRHYGVDMAELAVDADGDGIAGWSEAEFGTNPNDAASVPQPVIHRVSETAFQVSWRSIPGIGYQLQQSADAKLWVSVGPIQIGAGRITAELIELPAREQYFRLQSAPAPDSDSDGLTDYEEHLLFSNRSEPDTDDDGIPDAEEFLSGRDPLRLDPVTRERGIRSISPTHVIRADGSLWRVHSSGVQPVEGGPPQPRLTTTQEGTATDWALVSTTSAHGLAIRKDGSLWAWGLNSHGQLGLGMVSNTPVAVPTRVGTENDWSKVEAGGFGAAGLKKDGTLWEWGAMSSTVQSNAPRQVGVESTWQEVSAGRDHRLAIKRDGTLWSWGGNIYFQLGFGTTPKYSGVASPQQIGTDADWMAIHAGVQESVALKRDGSLWVWGANTDDNLSLLTEASVVEAPTRLGPWTDWVLVGSGVSAMRSDGTVWSWAGGRMTERMAGCRAFAENLALRNDGTLAVFDQIHFAWNEELRSGSLQLTPRRVDPHRWLAIDFVHTPTIAIRDDGSLWLWHTRAKMNRRQIGSETNWRAVAAGTAHHLLLKSDGTLWSMGTNSYGQAGTGGGTTGYDEPVQVGTDRDWHRVWAGGDRSYAAKDSGALWGWGKNGGALGVERADSIQATPIQIGSATWSTVCPAEQSNAGIQDDGSLWGWGRNEGGTGSQIPLQWILPEPLQPEHRWKDMTSGMAHWSAIRDDGTLWEWGSIRQVLPNIVTRTLVLSPRQIGTESAWVMVRGYQDRTLALQSNGTLWGWGVNYSGELGNGTTAPREAPGRIGTANDWVRVVCGSGHSAGLKRDGSLWLWGSKNGLAIPLATGPRRVEDRRDWGL